jgi:hypothetical protein
MKGWLLSIGRFRLPGADPVDDRIDADAAQER